MTGISTIRIEAGAGARTSVTRDGAVTYVEIADMARASVTSPMILGVDAAFPEYVSTFSAFKQARIARVYCTDGEGLIPWTARRLTQLPPHVLPHVSFRDWLSDSKAVAAVTAWLDAMPALVSATPALPELGAAVALTWLHEADTQLIPASVYQHRYEVLYGAVKAHRLGSLVAVVPVQTWSWTAMKSTGGKRKGDNNVLEYWAGCGDYAGIDCYPFTGDPYPDPAAWLAMPMRLARATGRRLWIPELATVKAPDDPGGVRRAAWITRVLAVLDGAGCAAASWWNSADGRHDFHLDEAGTSAWNGHANPLP